VKFHQVGSLKLTSYYFTTKNNVLFIDVLTSDQRSSPRLTAGAYLRRELNEKHKALQRRGNIPLQQVQNFWV